MKTHDEEHAFHIKVPSDGYTSIPYTPLPGCFLILTAQYVCMYYNKRGLGFGVMHALSGGFSFLISVTGVFEELRCLSSKDAHARRYIPRLAVAGMHIK